MLKLTTRGLCIVGALTIAIVVTASVTYVTLRLRVTYRVQYRIEELHQEVENLRQEINLFHKDLTKRVDSLEQTVYTLGEASDKLAATKKPPSPPRRPSIIEEWQLNREADLRKRITALERWRMEMSR